MSSSALSSRSTKAWEPDLEAAPTVLERYRVLGIIGKGGMGIVFKGYHLSLERHVAIKTMRVDRVGRPELVNRFRQEIKVVGQMDHEHVVRATDAGEKNGVFYLVMEYLTGSDLDKVVARHGPLAPAAACEMVRQAALGLEYIHRKLVHRDIKPSNLLLTPGGIVKILDLGLAHCDVEESGDIEQTPAGYALGTRAYMAPEQAQGSGTLDPRADIYSLGCTFFKLLTGTIPYGGPEYANTAKHLHAHCHVPLTTVPAFAAVPDNLKPILTRMMAKNPDDRYGSAREVAEILAPMAVGHDFGSLLSGASEADHVLPLTPPLPAELSRLTESVADTPLDTPTVSTVTVSPRPRFTGRRLAIATMLGLMLAGLAIVAWFSAAPLLQRTPPPPPPSPASTAPTEIRDLDGLSRREHLPLLDQMPLTLGSSFDDPRVCRWNRGPQSVDALNPPRILFLLGKTTQPRYTFEVSIDQSPWSGNVGVFWGYREDEGIKRDMSFKKDKKIGAKFAWFQALVIDRQPDKDIGFRYYVVRERCSAWWGKDGQIHCERVKGEGHEVSLKIREGVLQIEIEGDHLKSAHLAGLPLTGVYSTAATTSFADMPCQGALGLITLTHSVTFTNPRFICHSN